MATAACLLVPTVSLASEEFGIEQAFDKPAEVPGAAAAEMQEATDGKCFANRSTTMQDALEATPVQLGGPISALLIKPKQPSEPKAAWGCLCGAYTCPMWIYSIEGGGVRRLWGSSGVSLEILDRKAQGHRLLLLTSGSAGHQEAALHGWDSHGYKLSVVFGQGSEEDARAEAEMQKFVEEVSR
ncbi:hypothetical protein [Telmatospirillum sp.]|uniref:hypothetical protein n=1 Tax=Telmatospirillum sp. TaxID=2079197 RepID=UPI002843F45A|nr:hypothetical protein [Telmatospirillum sp.]MDR3437854.1 hypothetical protein [Telmatospirillum sp.]